MTVLEEVKIHCKRCKRGKSEELGKKRELEHVLHTQAIAFIFKMFKEWKKTAFSC